MVDKDQIIKEIEELPEDLTKKVLNYIKYLKKVDKSKESLDLVLVSESSLKKDWLKHEEEDVWSDL
ncbi:DUF2281 domain-containing protein [Natranaerofaba carboxydovora]|uniref:DUF2281 domain-containing protein n=1 Tax=Natranaerofaba carboxydovora TaxID=2742683 RepID=UPI001F147F57|nr:DUF2281 domain-containing protein [Natranaerofaba carboxydovora]UMZ74676.1 hypothetical protein ACONDI_02276 [Natranaerofaba carboxydovora]